MEENDQEYFDYMVTKKRRSETTTRVNIRRIRKFENVTGISREDLCDMDPKKITHLLEDLVGKMTEDENTPSYIHSVLKSVYTYLKWKDVSFKPIETPKGASSTPTLENETIPTSEQLKKIIMSAPNDRDRVATYLMAFTGIRPQTMGNSKGDDGLRVEDLEDLDFKNMEWKKTPVKIRIRQSLSKNGRSYFVFLADEPAEQLLNYLKDRNGITKKSPIITQKKHHLEEFLVTKSIRQGIRKAIRKAGYQWRPYILRRYFTARMMEAEFQNLMPYQFSQFLAGHSGDMLQRYTTNKGLADSQIEQMREAYKRSSKYLTTNISKIELEEAKNRIEEVSQNGDTVRDSLLARFSEMEKENKDLKKSMNSLLQLLGNVGLSIDPTQIDDSDPKKYEYVENNETTIIRKSD